MQRTRPAKLSNCLIPKPKKCVLETPTATVVCNFLLNLKAEELRSQTIVGWICGSRRWAMRKRSVVC
jgi:hypothetical protein